jgi:hypothetical protein
MNDKQENKLTMYEAVTALLDANTAKTSSMSAFATTLDSFKDILTALRKKNILKNTATAGKTTLKNQHQAELIASAVPIAGALFALGTATNDPRIQELGDIKKGDLLKLRDTELSDVVTSIKNLADGYAAGLVPYGVTPVAITALETKLTSYSTSVGGKESSFSTKVAAGKVLSDLFDDADGILKNQLDRMMEMFAPTDQQFYQEYKSAREIKDLGHRFDDDDDTPPDPTPPTP